MSTSTESAITTRRPAAKKAKPATVSASKPHPIVKAYHDIRDVDDNVMPTQRARRQEAVKVLQEHGLEYTPIPKETEGFQGGEGTGSVKDGMRAGTYEDKFGKFSLVEFQNARTAQKGDVVRCVTESTGYFKAGGLYRVAQSIDSDGEIKVVSEEHGEKYSRAVNFQLVLTAGR